MTDVTVELSDREIKALKAIVLPRFKRDYQTVRKHVEFDVATLEYVFDVLIAGEARTGGTARHTKWAQPA